MIRRGCLAVAFVCISAAQPVGAGAATTSPGCLRGAAPEAAARALLHPRASVVREEPAEALVSLPITMPAARHRLVRERDMWCDATAGFNATAGARGDETSVARSFASRAAARYFDGVTVRSAHLTGRATVELVTHARTNGVVARWTIAVDDRGVREATWTATAFLEEPFDAQPFGPTALPGATITYRRGGDGRIVAVDDPFDRRVAGAPPAGSSVVRTSDGFTIVVSRGHAPYVYPEEPTGVPDVDVLALAVRTTRKNYEDFLSWGLRGSWPGTGQVFVDGGYALFCGACVMVSPVFNVHISSFFIRTLEQSGYTYPDHDLAFSTVMGHEIFHNFQVSYGGASLPAAYIEGLARFQETLHGYSHVSHQPGSIVYAGGISGCSGYIETLGMEGPLDSHWYDACFFWMGFYADHGLPGLVRLLETSGDTASLAALVATAAGEPFADVVSGFAAHALTGQGLRWGPATGEGAVLDWAEHLLLWTPPAATPQTTVALLGGGGVTGGRITEATPVRVSFTDPDVRSTVVRRSVSGVSTTRVSDGDAVAAPAVGEDIWLVLASGSARAEVSFSVDAGPPGPVPAALAWDDFIAGGYGRAETPFQSWDTSASADVETLTFDLSADANEEAAGPFSVYADSHAQLIGSAVVPAGIHVLVLRVRFDTVDREERPAPLRSAYADVNVWAYVRCTSEGSPCGASDYGYLYDGPGTETLLMAVDVPTHQRLVVGIQIDVWASTTGGHARGAVSGQVTEARLAAV